MRSLVRLAAALAWICAGGAAAQAQTGTTLTLLPADPDRIDVGIYVGRQGVNRDEIASEWDRWYDAGQVAVSAGYYLTPNLKVEGAFARSATATMVVPEASAPTPPYLYFRTREHRFSSSTGSASIQYQFFRNQWFHPFAGVGVELLRERQRADALLQQGEIRSAGGVVVPGAPALPAISSTRTTLRPFAGTGFKVYVARRAFLRTDLQVAMSGGGAETATWRFGAGVDF